MGISPHFLLLRYFLRNSLLKKSGTLDQLLSLRAMVLVEARMELIGSISGRPFSRRSLFISSVSDWLVKIVSSCLFIK